jgi:hypothetical protein
LQADCSNYDGCHPWFYGGDNPQSLPLMMSHWENTYGESGVSRDANQLVQQARAKDRRFWPSNSQLLLFPGRQHLFDASRGDGPTLSLVPTYSDVMWLFFGDRRAI